MNNITNITELAEFFRDDTPQIQKIQGHVKPLRGETQKQCDARRKATALRIKEKNEKQNTLGR